MPAKSRQPTVNRRRTVLGVVAVALFALKPSTSLAQVSAQDIRVPAHQQGESASVAVPSMQNSITNENPRVIQTQRDDTLEIPENKGVSRGDSNRPDRSGNEDREGTPYIGITVRDTVMRRGGPLDCYLPRSDVAGMEIETVDAGSPAAEAGLRGLRTTQTKDYSVKGLLRRPSQLVDQSMATMDVYDTGGDLITEINGRRVLNTVDLNREFKAQRLRPGDTVYVTVMRRVRSWHSKTLRFPVRLGEWTTPRTVTIQDQPSS